MGGACRESYRLTVNRRWLRPSRIVRAVRWNWRLILKDNLGWLPCLVLGHRAYNTSTLYEPPEHACSRCGNWLRHLDPKPGEWQPSPEVAEQRKQWVNAKPLGELMNRRGVER